MLESRSKPGCQRTLFLRAHDAILNGMSDERVMSKVDFDIRRRLTNVMAFAAIMNARITKIQKGNIEAFLN